MKAELQDLNEMVPDKEAVQQYGHYSRARMNGLRRALIASHCGRRHAPVTLAPIPCLVRPMPE